MLADLPPDFELDHLELALEYVSDFSCAVDGGANIGIWSVAMAKRFDRVLAFEPVRANRDRIPTLANLTTLPFALGAEPANAAMAPGETNIGEWHIVDGHGAMVAALDDFVLDELSFLKLDVEGYELFALQGARQTIERCKPVICVESKWHSTRYGVPEGDEIRYAESLGYHVVARIGRDVILTCR